LPQLVDHVVDVGLIRSRREDWRGSHHLASL
jgi:hypothetical protein